MQQKIKKLMEIYCVTFEELSIRLGVSKQTLTRKMNGTTDWTYNEIMLLTQLFNIEEPQDFFFGGN